MATAAATRSRWLYGPATDLLVGCGLWYALAFLIFAVAGPQIHDGGGLTLAPFLALIFGAPHYGATLLRVYERREDRQAYSVFAVAITAIVVLAFVAGVHSIWVGSLVLTLYLTWSPWHYSGQNYGLAVMFLRRRGVALEPRAKRLLYASFLLSYAMTFLALHSGAEGSHYAPLSYDAQSYRFVRIGLPNPWADWAFSAAAVAYAVCLVGAGALLRRHGSLRDLLPTGALVATQALWFSVPLVLRSWHIETGIDPWESNEGAYYFLWIAVGHSVQYVWVTSYYARIRGGGARPGRYLAKALLAGAALWVVPALLFAPGVLGRLPFDGGLSVLVASAVNLHHFVLDGAIWKLRDGRVAGVLLRPAPAVALAPPIGPTRRRWPRVLGWAAGAVCLFILVGAKWERDVALRRAAQAGDVERVRRSVTRLALVGRDSAALRLRVGRELAQRGRTPEARAEYRRALSLQPSVAAWHSIGVLNAHEGDWRAAVDAYTAALALEPEDELALRALGLAHLELGEPALARDAFERAARANPERGLNQRLLERAERTLEEAGGY